MYHPDLEPVTDAATDDAVRRPTCGVLEICEDGSLRVPGVPDEPLHPYPYEGDFWRNAEELR